jgi:hypothetical protein
MAVAVRILAWHSYGGGTTAAFSENVIPLYNEGDCVSSVPEQVLGVLVSQVSGVVIRNLLDDVATTHFSAFVCLFEQRDNDNDARFTETQVAGHV